MPEVENKVSPHDMLRLIFRRRYLFMVGAAMAARARRVVAVADATKLGNAGFTPIVGIDAVHVLVTDERADPALVADLRRRGLEVLVV